MKRIFLSFAAVAALTLGGLFTNSAQAHGPFGGGRCYNNYGYRNYGYGGGYGLYSGYSPYSAYRTAPVIPYGAGYSGGWQPYQGFYSQQPRFGLYMGF